MNIQRKRKTSINIIELKLQYLYKMKCEWEIQVGKKVQV
jgi:hypothetical protein